MLCSDIDTTDERHEDGSGCFWGKRREFLEDQPPAREQPLFLGSALLGIGNSTEQSTFIDEEGAEPSNDETFEIAGRDAPPCEWSLAAPVISDFET